MGTGAGTSRGRRALVSGKTTQMIETMKEQIAQGHRRIGCVCWDEPASAIWKALTEIPGCEITSDHELRYPNGSVVIFSSCKQAEALAPLWDSWFYREWMQRNPRPAFDPCSSEWHTEIEDWDDQLHSNDD
jgi:hypothetical protein